MDDKATIDSLKTPFCIRRFELLQQSVDNSGFHLLQILIEFYKSSFTEYEVLF